MKNRMKVGSYIHRQDAGVAKGILDENGIDSLIRADDVAGLQPYLSLSGEGVSLFVAKKDLLRAKEALAVLEIPSEDYNADGEIEFMRLKKDAKWFPVMVVISMFYAIVSFWFFWQSIALEAPGNFGFMFGGTVFLFGWVVSLFTCMRMYQSRQKYNIEIR